MLKNYALGIKTLLSLKNSNGDNMFNNYKIVGDTLYLTVGESSEIGSFFGEGKEDLADKVRDYIIKNKISFDGKKVVLVINGLMIGTVYLTGKQNAVRQIVLSKNNGGVKKIDFNDYLIGVVASQMPASYGFEALKAQALVARTYALRLLETKRRLTGDDSSQTYFDEELLKNVWEKRYDEYYKKVKEAVLQTDGLCIKFKGELIDAVHHALSNGYTISAYDAWGINVPYLKSVSSFYDKESPDYKNEVLITYDNFSKVLNKKVDRDTLIKVIKRDDTNHVLKVKVGNADYTGVQLRSFLGLNSTDFDVSLMDEGVLFTTRGIGHGVGLSVYAAGVMAEKGYDYKTIIKHYYPGVEIKKE